MGKAHLWRAAVIGGLTVSCWAQTNAPKPAVLQSPYVDQSRVASSSARSTLIALGDRLQKAGSERIVYTGSLTDASGATPATVTWELPGYLRLDLAARSKTYLIDAVAGVSNAAGLNETERDMLESLHNDIPEAFLYNVSGTTAFRFLGARFRNDNGKDKNYQGPYYDVFQTGGPVLTRKNEVAWKLYYFDSHTKLLAKTTYHLRRGSAAVPVVVEFSNWTVVQGNAVPGQIVRRENGVVVFTLSVKAAAIGPHQDDGIFSNP